MKKYNKTKAYNKKERSKKEKPKEKLNLYKAESHFQKDKQVKDNKIIRLNKFIAHAGICSRREADNIIMNGDITVNGKIITEMGTKILKTDIVKYKGKILEKERLVYVLLNKPKNFISTVSDPHERKTVMNLVKNACEERIFPVGRLDRNTTGVLLFTNDGDLAKKLTHPKYKVEKIYYVELNKTLINEDMLKIVEGLELEDGFIKVDEINYINGDDEKNKIGIKIHSGKNHIVRRIFEELNYKVERLDRVKFAGLTKKNLKRGEWRLLMQKEINLLKMTL
jgi:23S rRNA pseudouridine2605 synthase